MSNATLSFVRSKFAEWLLDDFGRFCQETKLIYPYSKQPHDEMCAEVAAMVPDFAGGLQRKKLFLSPRGSFKTSIVTAFIIYLLLKYPQIKILLYRATRETAQQMLREIKDHLTLNDVILSTFGDLSAGAKKWDEDSIIISTRVVAPGDRDPSVMTIGADGQTTGFHPDIVFMDDVVTEQNCDSVQLMEKAWRIMQSVYGLLQPYGTSLVSGTRWSAIDCYQKILDANEKAKEAGDDPPYETYVRTVYVTDPQTGETGLFFPTRLTQEFIDKQRTDPTLESRYFESWYFNRMVDPRAKPFKTTDLHFFDCDYTATPYHYLKLTDEGYAGEEVDLYVAMIIDPSQTGNAGSDAYGFSVCGFDKNRNFMMLESRELVDVPSNADGVIQNLLLEYQPDLLIIESSGGDAALMTRIGGFIERMGLRTVVRGYSALQDEVHGKRAKWQRINAMEPFVSKGYVWIRRGFCSELIRQMDLYPSLVRDDVIDSFAMCRHALKFLPDVKAFARRKLDEGLEPDPYAVTYYDKKSGKEMTVGWDEFHANPLEMRRQRSNVSKGSWVGR